MSGRKQHFIPQSLLRGFGVEKGKKTYVVAYTYDRGVFSPPTDGIGAQRDFYSELDVERITTTLDDKITDYEQRIPAILEQLRKPSTETDRALAAELVTHLTVRNDHFRKATADGGATLFQGMSEVLSKEETAKSLLGVAGDKPSEMFAAELPKMWDKLAPLAAMMGMNEEQFREWAFQTIKSNFSSFHAEMAGTLNDTFSGMIEKVPDVAANAQRRSLTETLTPPKRVDRLSEFRWQTVESEEPLVLPDCVALGADTESGILPLMLADLDKTETIFMPIASDRLLAGSLNGTVEIQTEVNRLFAACSWDFFVARDRTNELDAYRALLRTTSQEFMSATVSEVIEESLAKDR